MNPIPFKAEHYKLLVPLLGLPEAFNVDQAVLEQYEGLGTVWSGEKEGRILMVSGVIPLHQGVYMGFAFISQDARDEMTRKALPLTRLIRKKIEEMQKQKGFHRLQITVEFNYWRGYRWAKALGFQKEGELIAYGCDKRTHTQFSRIWL